MPLFHAVVWIDHHHAEVVQFDAAQVLVRKVQSHDYETRQHGSAVRTEHEFFGEVCDELADINEVFTQTLSDNAILHPYGVGELGEPGPFQLDVRLNRAEPAHSRTNSPLFLIERSAASNIRTTRKPASPSLNGVLLFKMHSAK